MKLLPPWLLAAHAYVRLRPWGNGPVGQNPRSDQRVVVKSPLRSESSLAG